MTATETWMDGGEYEAKCQHTGHPPAECARCKEIINSGEWKVKVAKQNLDMGYLPPAEVAELEQLKKDLASCP